MLKHRFFLTQWLEIPIKVSFKLDDFDFKPQICQEPKKLAELGVRNFFVVILTRVDIFRDLLITISLRVKKLQLRQVFACICQCKYDKMKNQNKVVTHLGNKPVIFSLVKTSKVGGILQWTLQSSFAQQLEWKVIHLCQHDFWDHLRMWSRVSRGYIGNSNGGIGALWSVSPVWWCQDH